VYCLTHLTIFLCPGAQTEPSAYHLTASHSIQPPFNYAAGTSQCFLIIICLSRGHHLMMKYLLQKVWAFAFLLSYLLFVWAFLFLSCRFVRLMRVFLDTAGLFLFYIHILLSGLTVDVLSSSVLFLYSTPSATCIQCDFTLDLSSPPLGLNP